MTLLFCFTTLMKLRKTMQVIKPHTTSLDVIYVDAGPKISETITGEAAEKSHSRVVKHGEISQKRFSSTSQHRKITVEVKVVARKMKKGQNTTRKLPVWKISCISSKIHSFARQILNLVLRLFSVVTLNLKSSGASAVWLVLGRRGAYGLRAASSRRKSVCIA